MSSYVDMRMRQRMSDFIVDDEGVSQVRMNKAKRDYYHRSAGLLSEICDESCI
jgi:hypothetical protein